MKDISREEIMKINEFLENVCSQIKYQPIKNALSEELRCHMEEEVDNYIETGMEKKVAENKVIENMGDAKKIGKLLNKVHKPKLDWTLLLISSILLFFGFLTAYMRVVYFDLPKTGCATSTTKFVLFIVVSLFIGSIIYLFDYKKIKKFSMIFYCFSTILLICSIFCFGIELNGRIHFNIYGILIRPDIVTLPLYAISFVGIILENKNNSNKKNVNIIIMMAVSLILLSKVSFLSSFILLLSYLLIIYNNKEKNNIILFSLLFILSTIILIVIFNSNEKIFNKEELYNYFNMTESNNELLQKNIIMKKAKLLGAMDNIKNIPIDFFKESNYTCIMILACYGWLPFLSMIVTIIFLCIKLVINTLKTHDMYGKLLVIGITSIFIGKIILDIIINLIFHLNSEIAIPFVTWGGHELIINVMCMSLILSIYRRKDIVNLI